MNSVPRVISLGTTNVMKLKQNPALAEEQPGGVQGNQYAPSFQGKAPQLQQVTNSVKLPSAKTAMAIGAAALLALGMSSCTKKQYCKVGENGEITDLYGNLINPSDCDDFIDRYNGGNTSVYQSVEVNVNIDWSQLGQYFDNLTAEMRAQFAALLAQMAAEHQDDQAIWNTIRILMEQMGVKMDQIIMILGNQGVGIDRIIQLLEENNQSLTDLLAGQQALIGVAQNIETAVNTNNNLTAQQSQVLSAIYSHLLAMKNSIDNGFAQNNQDNAQIIALMNYLISQVGNMEANDASRFATLMQKLNVMDNNRAAESAAILNAIQDVDLHVQAGVAALITNNNTNTQSILDKMDDMNDAQQASYAAILANMNNWRLSTQGIMFDFMDKLDTIIANQNQQNLHFGTIIQNQGTQIQQLGTIIDLIQAGNLNIAAIKDFLENFQTQYPEVDLSAIETLLEQILAKTTQNGLTLGSINNKLDLLQSSVNAVRGDLANIDAHVTGFAHDNLMYLDSILNKIPTDFTNCGGGDTCCRHQLERLDTIINILRTGRYDTNHEGFRDDYGDILGAVLPEESMDIKNDKFINPAELPEVEYAEAEVDGTFNKFDRAIARKYNGTFEPISPETKQALNAMQAKTYYV